MIFLQTKRLLGTVLLGGLGSVMVPQCALAGDLPLIGDISWIAFNYAPKGWAFCNGALLPIIQNQALYSLLGTTYGGDGRFTFALPDMRGRAPIHVGPGHNLGAVGGEETHALTVNEMPTHTHVVSVDSKEAAAAIPGVTTYLAKTSTGTSAYAATATTSLAGSAVSVQGGNQAHGNMKPFIALNCIIALQGTYPSRN